MSEISDWIIAIFTVVLSGATIALAWNTGRLVKVTKEVSDATESVKIMPSLTFNEVQPLSGGAGVYVRFSVKNVGFGPAKYSNVKARLTSGQELKVRPHSLGDVIEAGVFFYWDVSGVKVGSDVEMAVTYTDLRGRLYPTFKHTFPVH